MRHRALRGTIRYPSAKPEHLGQEGGREHVTVTAGHFDALHFRYVDTAGQLPEEHPPYDAWCTADGNCVYLKGGVGGYMQSRYELVGLSGLDG